MTPAPSPVAAFLSEQLRSDFDSAGHLRQMLARANGNASRNSYIVFDPEWSSTEMQRQFERFSAATSKPRLFGLPVSLKDCFDLKGFHTSSGSKFYATHLGPATEDSAMAAALRGAGAVITGKTHMQQLAYGITGENQDYGDCLQPADATRLTGGSSSGGAASIQEGSALAAIGTDTGGSIRVPAAICGLAGYRSSHGVADWRGGAHLAPSYDTIGWLFRDLRDAPLLADAVFHLPPTPQGRKEPSVVGVLAGPLVEECDAAVLRSLEEWKSRIERQGMQLKVVDGSYWPEAWDLYAPLQAYEAARVHAGFFSQFEPAIASRLEWGASLGEDEVAALKGRQQMFRARMEESFRSMDFLLAPATPLSKLVAGSDQTPVRPRILRLTTPASITGLPAVVLPSADCGLQLLAAHNDDRRLLQFAAKLGWQLAQDQGLTRMPNRES